ncbi:MAG TPA: DnaA/Hda family protein [Gemmataceae bacterium]|nr:DnaA/Hda family protein [Gemmataceae bacterium]
MYTFTHWVTTPENRFARAAVRRVADSVAGRRRAVNPLFLHGPAGTGKTHLVNALATAVTRRCPDLIVCLLPAADCRPEDPQHPEEWTATAKECDLLVVEDVQHLPRRSVEALIGVIDDRRARGRQIVFTALEGPGQLTRLPERLTSRLACGLVVGLEPLAPASRLAFLQDRARRRRLAVGPDVLAWLAEHVRGSARQLEGALKRLEALARLQGRVPDVAAVAETFRGDADAARPSVERIIERVGRYFRVEPGQLRSRRRGRNALLPRQVGMYLARMLTPLSLEQIGAHFGGRDHSTVLHACRKVEQALARDTDLSGAVRQLHADLG